MSAMIVAVPAAAIGSVAVMSAVMVQAPTVNGGSKCYYPEVQLSRLMSHRRAERDHFRRSRLMNRRIDPAGRGPARVLLRMIDESRTSAMSRWSATSRRCPIEPDLGQPPNEGVSP
jgi:hypothetical protein